jgi:AcrR family transcriptional regulator
MSTVSSVYALLELEMPKIIDNEQVYQAVLQTIIARGYAGATTKQLAEAADISEVTLFRKYGSKIQLVKQAIGSIIAQADFEGAAEYSGDLAADLLKMVQAYQESAVKHGQFFAILLSEMPRYPEMMEMIDAPFGIFKSMGQLLARYQAEGVLRQEHPLHALAALLGPLIYIAMMRNAKYEDLIPPLDLSLHVDNYIRGRSVDR